MNTTWLLKSILPFFSGLSEESICRGFRHHSRPTAYEKPLNHICNSFTYLFPRTHIHFYLGKNRAAKRWAQLRREVKIQSTEALPSWPDGRPVCLFPHGSPLDATKDGCSTTLSCILLQRYLLVNVTAQVSRAQPEIPHSLKTLKSFFSSSR